MSHRNVARNAAIVDLHVTGGLMLSEIAVMYGLTRERVRQIVTADFGIPLTRERQAAARVKRAQERAAGVASRRAYKHSLAFIRDRAAVDENGCWIWQRAKYPTGYGSVSLNRGGGYAHRLTWEIVNGRPIPAGLCICHHCDVPSCVNPEHLFLGTHQENVHDAQRKGRRRVKVAA